MKIVYVSVSPLSEHILVNWFIKDLLSIPAVEVEYWHVGDQPIDYKYAPHGIGCRGFPSWREAGKLAKSYSMATFVLLFEPSFRFLRFFRTLSKVRCRTVFLARGYLPRPSRSFGESVGRIIRDPVKYASIAIGGLCVRLAFRVRLCRPFDIVFASGNYARRAHENKHTRVVPVHLFDYDAFERGSREPRAIEGHYAVFIDQNLPTHPDLALAGYSPVNREEYYLSLRRFFERVEELLGIPVVIALHPSAEFGDQYGNRIAVKAKTANIVRHADVAILHFSTALSYLVLSNVPALFIINSQLTRHYRDTIVRSIYASATSLGCQVYNIDTLDSYAMTAVVHNLKVDATQYTAYRDEYITSGIDPAASSAEVFVATILESDRMGVSR